MQPPPETPYLLPVRSETGSTWISDNKPAVCHLVQQLCSPTSPVLPVEDSTVLEPPSRGEGFSRRRTVCPLHNTLGLNDRLVLYGPVARTIARIDRENSDNTPRGVSADRQNTKEQENSHNQEKQARRRLPYRLEDSRCHPGYPPSSASKRYR